MHKLFKSLTLVAFITGLFLYLSGDKAYFNGSGGTGLVLFMIGTPLFAILTQIFKEKTKVQHASVSPWTNKLLRNGLIMLVAGFFIYSSGFVVYQGFDGIRVIILGVFVGLVGIITLLIGALRH